MTVELRDSATGEPICDGEFHITAPEVDVTFVCPSDAGPTGCCSFATNGPGGVAYTISVTAIGYAATTKQVAVPEDECGQPITQHVTVEMHAL